MKQSVLYADFVNSRWLAVFDRIEEGQKVSARGAEFIVDWKYEDPPWIRLRYLGRRREYVMVRKGDSLLLELA